MTIARRDILNGLDREFGEFLGQRASPATRESVVLAAVWLSQAVRQGHVCFPLNAPITGEAENTPAFPEPDAWRQDLLASGVVGEPGAFAPLILDAHSRLYLHRYYEYEERLANRLKELLAKPAACLWKPAMNAYFTTGKGLDWQKIAAFTALHRHLCVITGGPGTGKTWTMVRILGLLFEIQPTMRLAMAAPTGRAAARVGESVATARATLPEGVGAGIPTDATTIHRLLGTIPGSPRFHFNRTNPLPFDTVVVDEASMVDLPLMAKLVEALPMAARLILVGDSDQLSSVQAGNVLADLCIRRNFFSPDFRSLAQEAGLEFPEVPHPEKTGDFPLIDSVVELRATQRFDSGGGIQKFCEHTRSGDYQEALTISRNPDSEIRLIEIRTDAEIDLHLRNYAEEFVQPWFASTEARNSLALLNRSRVLCAHRSGSRGVEGINRRIEAILAKAGNISSPIDSFYLGKPVMVTINDYQQGLFNGDTGIIIQADEGTSRNRAVFGMEEGELRYFHPAQLPPHETAYAISVHKSQGSEYEHAILILPENTSQLLSRELIYTAASRAKKRVEIWGSAAVLEAAIGRRVQRVSGLPDRLSGDA